MRISVLSATAAILALAGLAGPGAQAAAVPPGPGMDIVVKPYYAPGASEHAMYRYDRETGKGGLARDDQYDWGTGWTHIVPYGGWKKHILFYNRSRGRGEVRRLDRNGAVGDVVHTYTGWRRSWDIVVNLGTRCILFYSRNGSANIYFADKKDGSVRERVFSTNKWTKNWSHIVDMPGGVLFYKRGHARIYDMGAKCKFKKVTYKSKSWRKTWTHIMPITGSKGITPGISAMLMYDRNAGKARIYRYNASKGKPGKRLKEYNGWRKTWDAIVFRRTSKDQTALRFYDKETGGYNYYRLTRGALLGKRLN